MSLPKKTAWDTPQCIEMCRPRTCRKRPIGANRTGLDRARQGMTLVYSIQYTLVSQGDSPFPCSWVTTVSLTAGPGHSWSFCGTGGGLPTQVRAALQSADGLLQIWERYTVSIICIHIMTDERKLQRILNS